MILQSLPHRFKRIPDFPDYAASYDGKIIRISKCRSGSGKPGKELKQKIYKEGYFMVTVWKNKKAYKRYVHGLIASAFLGKRPKTLETDHIDGNKLHNCAHNLRYLTRRENALHALELNLGPKTSAKLSIQEVRKIRKLITSGLSDLEISKFFDVGRTCIKEIRAGRNWAWLK